MKMGKFQIGLGAVIGLGTLLFLSSGRADDATVAGEPMGTMQNRSSSQSEKSPEIVELLSVLRDARAVVHEPEQVVRAMNRLRELRAAEATDDLVALLDFKRPHSEQAGDGIVEIRPRTEFSNFPAMGALVEIGEPAIASLTRAVEDTKTSILVKENAVSVLQQIFRFNPKGGAEYLDSLARRVGSGATADRLAAAATKLRDSSEH
jgi:hypothetical protein